MTHVDVFEFSDFKEYLRVAATQCHSRRNRTVKLKELSSKLGYRSPRSVAMVLKGQRLPSSEMVDKMSRYFSLKEQEHRYFELLIQLEKCKKKKEDPRAIVNEINRVHPGLSKPNIDSKTFAFIADWYHFVIKQHIASGPSENDPKSIVKALRGKVTETEVREAIQTMLELGIIEKQKNNRLSVVKDRVTTSQGVPDQALRKHHKGMIARALESIEEEDFDNREITSITLRMDPQDVKAAKKAIRQFRDQFHKQFESNHSKHVFQMNFQLFEHTKPEQKSEE